MKSGKYKKVCGIISVILLAAICFGVYEYKIAGHNSSGENTAYRAKTDKKTGQETSYGKSTYTDNGNTVKNKNRISSTSQKNITTEQAVKKAAECYGNKNENTRFVFDHKDVRDNVPYYVIQVFDSMEDHSATSDWYYINEKNGRAYKLDLGQNRLIPVN